MLMPAVGIGLIRKYNMELWNRGTLELRVIRDFVSSRKIEGEKTYNMIKRYDTVPCFRNIIYIES